MKAALDWIRNDTKGHFDMEWVTQDECIEFVKAIQLDAYRQACTDIEKLIKEYPDTDTPVSDFTQEIIKLRNHRYV